MLPLLTLVAWQAATPMIPLIGEPAPPIKIAQWLKGNPVNELEKGKIYVIDIWAPWCDPCKNAMPQLTQLQKQYASKGVVFIGLTGDDDYGATLAKAQDVVKQKGDLIGYRIAWDDQKKTYTKWMKLESSAGWPWAFIVDRTGKVAYIGHPSKMPEALRQVVAGTWDLGKAKGVYRQRVWDLLAGRASPNFP